MGSSVAVTPPRRKMPDARRVDQPQPMRASQGDRVEGGADTNSPGSVTNCIASLRERADQRAAEFLVKRYWQRLTQQLGRRINPRLQSVSDSEDVAAFVISEVLRALGDGGFPDLDSRDSLWALMLSVADKRCKHEWRRYTAGVRDRRRESGQSSPPHEEHPSAVDFAAGSRDFAPEFIAELEDVIAHLARTLGDEYRDLLIWELQGRSRDEMLSGLQEKWDLSIGDRQLRRKLERIRSEVRLAFDA